MPRAVLARTTFVFAASTSCLFATLASAGFVSIGAYDDGPNGLTADAHALARAVVPEKQSDFSIDDWAMGQTLLGQTLLPSTVDEGGAIPFFMHTNTTSFDETDLFALNALVDESRRLTGSRVRTTVADGMHPAGMLNGPVSVPLPGAVWTSIIGLAGVAWLKRRVEGRRRTKGRGEEAEGRIRKWI